MTGRTGLAAAALLLFGSTASAHPHSYVDQQALLSVGLDVMGLTIRIVPSFEEGAAIFAHIDRNGNGIVSDDEAFTFAASVVAKAALEVDGRRVVFRTAKVNVPSQGEVSAGSGMIEVEATAPFVLSSSGDHRLAFDIAYEELSHDWFVQPFFYRDFVEATVSQAVERTDAGNQVGVVFSYQRPVTAESSITSH